MSDKHTALVVTEIGKPVVKVLRDTPTPGSGEYLVQVSIAGLNAHDAKSRDDGLFIADSLPSCLATDVVGTVTKVGPDVHDFKPGDHVFGQAQWNGLQELAILNVLPTRKAPVGFTDEQLATLPTNLITSVVGLFDPSGLGIPPPWSESSKDFDYASTRLLIVGGGSNCGKYAVQLASLAGIGTIVVVASTRNEAELKSYGATHVIDRYGTSDQVVSHIRAIVGDDLLYALDTINPAPGQALAINALSNTRKGKLARLVTSASPDESLISKEKKAGYELKDVLGVVTLRLKTCGPFMDHLPQYLHDGKIKPLTKVQTIKGLDVDGVNKKLDGYMDGTVTGQVLVDLRR